MNARVIMRVLSVVMLIIAAVFVIVAISVPTLGSVIYIGKFEFGVEQWRVCYVMYVVVMIALFVGSFSFKNHK